MRYDGHLPRESRAYNLLAGDRRLSAHFRLSEFACRDGSAAVLVHPALIDLLEALRTRLGAPVTIISGYRTAHYNRQVGGGRASRHLWGMAADITVAGVPPAAVADAADALGVGGLGRYPGFTHVDVEGQGRRW